MIRLQTSYTPFISSYMRLHYNASITSLVLNVTVSQECTSQLN